MRSSLHPSMTVTQVTVDGTELAVVDTGEPADPRPGSVPLLLVNGAVAPVEVLLPLALKLAPGRRVIAFDQPGMGHSRPVFPPAGIPQLACLASGLLRRLGVPVADVLGYSFGGAVAQQLALTSPRLVRRLVLASSVYGLGGVPSDPISGLSVFAHHCLGIHRVELIRDAARRAYGGVVRREPGRLTDFEAAVSSAPADPLSRCGQAWAFCRWTSLPWLWALRAPTLVLHGDNDRVVPLMNARILAGLIPGARCEILAGAGHLMVLDQPEDVAEVIESFIAATPTPSR